jgi:hypothetical protein
MIPPDQEIYEVEKRIAERRHRVEAAARASGRQAMRALTSPWALLGAAAIGFLVAGGVARKHESSPHVSRDTKEKAKGGAMVSLGMAALTWLIKAQFGSPVAMAQYFLAKFQKKDKVPAMPARSSLRSDKATLTTRR